MARQRIGALDGIGYAATDEDRAGIEAWFRRYDELAEKIDLDGMADLAYFPLNLVTDGDERGAFAGQWTRQQYLEGMKAAMGSGEVSMDSTRTPVFLTDSLAVVITDATMTWDGQTQTVSYADVLVKTDGRWLFQTMIQGGWAAAMREGVS
ncbi:DUF4440 domain-containing protein [Amycolatopsis sp. CA-230715]|uniref:DUF4440 domain-containing protein n=1 Tax=Amycolatopsis sp. CA-230715 TaxID=2745196 RepID=UPI001C00A191|nr:DUF4440 domain-containing protein [Amycolatopsis sp. CA-230715]QWF82360.1 hypothetical protein HUW46_05797 [Amycolatopsis sp. CA-230715]